MNGRRDATERRRRGGKPCTRSRASVAAIQVAATHGVAGVEPMWQQDEVAARAVVHDEPCDEPRDVPRDVPKKPDVRRSRSSR
jgi:hypothetical protein